MTTTFPGAIDALSNPAAGDSMASPSHAAQHADANDAIEALETFALGSATDVRSYGATGDGITDDTAALQAAIDATPEGGTLRIPVGIFLFSTLDIDRRISVQGAGWSCDWFTAMGAPPTYYPNTHVFGSVLRSTATSGSAIVCEQANGSVVIRDVLIVGPGSGTTIGLKLSTDATYLTACRFDRVGVMNFSVGIDAAFVVESVFHDTHIRGCTTGIRLHDAFNANAFFYTDVQFTTADGIVASAGDVGPNMFYGGLLQDCTGNAAIRTAVATAEHLVFEGFYLERCDAATYAVDLTLGQHLVLRSSHFSSDGGDIRTGAAYTTIENLRHYGSGAITISARYARISQVQGFTVTDSGWAGSIVEPFFTGGHGMPRYATEDRPDATATFPGGAIYDLSLSKPIYSDGTVWRDAAGSAV